MKKITRNTNDQMIFGVCSGIADYMNIDVSILRLLCVVGFFITGTLLFWIYVLLALILPSK